MPSGAGGTQTSPATLHHLQNPKWPVWGPKWQTGSGKVSTPQVFGRSSELLPNKFLDSSTPSLRKGSQRRKKWKIMMFIVATNVVTSRPPGPNTDQLECRLLVPIRLKILFTMLKQWRSMAGLVKMLDFPFKNLRFSFIKPPIVI